MITIEAIRRPISSELESFEQFLRDKFSAKDGIVAEMIDYILTSRGKGVRPILVMLSAAINGSSPLMAGSVRVILAASLIEMTHVASLIHDDVIDEADMRRGMPSVNARWQSHKSVLIGDYILAKNIGLGMSSGQYDLVSHVSEALAKLCEGELIQSQSVEQKDFSRLRYFDVINKKTASLMGVSAMMGAIAVKAPQDRITQMRAFGEAIGIAFQIKDDILDYSSGSVTGKSSNNDLREGKITLPLILVLEQCTKERQDELLELLARCADDPQSVDRLQEIVKEQGGIEAATKVMENYLSRAVQILSEYDISEYRDALVNLCAYIGQRDK